MGQAESWQELWNPQIKSTRLALSIGLAPKNILLWRNRDQHFGRPHAWKHFVSAQNSAESPYHRGTSEEGGPVLQRSPFSWFSCKHSFPALIWDTEGLPMLTRQPCLLVDLKHPLLHLLAISILQGEGQLLTSLQGGQMSLQACGFHPTPAEFHIYQHLSAGTVSVLYRKREQQ